MINSPYIVHTLYESDMSTQTTKKELMDFIPKIESFIRTYMIDYKTQVKIYIHYIYNKIYIKKFNWVKIT